ncbi:hypothetical protein JOM56_011791 [Amanita muscaria]
MALPDTATIAIATILILVLILILPFAKRLDRKVMQHLRFREVPQLPINSLPREDPPKYSPHREPPPAYTREPVMYPPEFTDHVIPIYLPMPVTTPNLSSTGPQNGETRVMIQS